MRVVGVVYNHRATKTVTVLGRQVAMVPEGPGLPSGSEVVQERIILRDGALVYKCRTVGPVGALLEETMPVLQLRLVSV